MPAARDTSERPAASRAPAADNPGPLSEALRALRAASTTPAKQRDQKTAVPVNAICNHAYQNGLDREELRAVVAIAARRTLLDQTSLTNLVKNLYPAERVPSDVVFTIVASLGQGSAKASVATQTALLKWLVATNDAVEDASALSRLYGVLFNLLDMLSLRAPLCHLLCLITRRRHVRPFRIQQLLELVRVAGPEPALIGLLRVYKDYYPDIILGSTASGRTSLPVQTQDEWRLRMHAIQEAHAVRVAQDRPQQNGFKVIRQGAKRTKVSVLPEVRTSRAHEASVTLEEVENADDLANLLDKIELPNQLISSLKDPLLQKYLILNPSDAAVRRIESWLESYFREVLDVAKTGSPPPAHLAEILRGLVSYSQSCKTLLPVAQQFLASYFPLWDGSSDCDLVADLLGYVPVLPFEEFRASYLRPAEAAMIASGREDAQERIVTLYTHLIRRIANVILTEKHNRSAGSLESLLSSFDELTSHVASTILSIVSSTRLTTSTASSVLTLYTILARLSTSTPNHTIRIIIPPAHTTYLLLHHPSLSTLSHLSHLLATYKRSFEAALPMATYPDDYTNRFNGYLMDVCNLLWRSRALSAADTNALACLCPEPVAARLRTYLRALDPDYSLAAIFGLSCNALTTATAAAALRRLEDAAEEEEGGLRTRHGGPATQRSLTVLAQEGGIEVSWRDYRVEVLKWMVERGVGGVKELMYVTMRDLMKATR